MPQSDGACGFPSPAFAALRHPLPLRKASLLGERGSKKAAYPAGIAGTGSAVTDLIFSIAKREVTFLSDTAAISFL